MHGRRSAGAAAQTSDIGALTYDVHSAGGGANAYLKGE
jgi:hypothetical protein